MGSKKKNDDKNLITDPRFSSVHWDPRFKNAPKHKTKVEIDDRFKAMLTDPRFDSSSAPTDKRGKLKNKAGPGEKLRDYYQTNQDEEEAKYIKVKPKQDDEEDELSEEEEEDKAKLEEEESESEELEEDDVAGSESETDTDYDDEEEEVVIEDGMPVMQTENIPEIEKETNRLAVVNLDWRYVKAVDLFVVLRSFLPKGGEIKSVAVYPSDFGIERMKEEEIHGPVGLFDKKDEEGDEESDSDDEDEEVINQKMRAYEKSRLRYYYAVVECDSVATADYLYRNCDGVEFERSSNTLDLRFIPDSLEMKHPARDIATEVASNYVGLDFQTRALQQSKVDISWDEDEPGRRTLKRKFTADQLDEMEMKEFLASDESDSDEAEDDEAEAEDEAEDRPDKKSQKSDMYLALIQAGDGDGEEDGEDMEVTFNTGLEDLSKRLLEKKDRGSETFWDAHLRKRREKKKAKRNRSNDSSEDESSDSYQEAKEEPDDFFTEEPSVKKSKKESHGKRNKEEKQRQDMDKEAEASRNELELLLTDVNGADKGLKGYNLKKSKKAKGKKGKEVPEEEKIPTADFEDPRFAPLFTSSLFALDPTDPQFKRSATYIRQAALRQQKGDPEEVPEREVKVQSEGLSSKIEKSSLIKSIKMKAKSFEKKEELLPFPGRKETKIKQDTSTSVQPVKKKAKVGRK